MLVMQVIDETNNAGISFRRTSRLLVPIYGNNANEQNGPPMNADKRRWNQTVLIGVHPRSSGAKYRPSEFSSRTANRWSTPHAQFPERDVSTSLRIAPQPMFKAPQRMKPFWLCESTARDRQRDGQGGIVLKCLCRVVCIAAYRDAHPISPSHGSSAIFGALGNPRIDRGHSPRVDGAGGFGLPFSNRGWCSSAGRSAGAHDGRVRCRRNR